MRKPIVTIVSLLFLAALVLVTARLITSDGPCAPKEPPPLGAP